MATKHFTTGQTVETIQNMGINAALDGLQEGAKQIGMKISTKKHSYSSSVLQMDATQQGLLPLRRVM